MTLVNVTTNPVEIKITEDTGKTVVVETQSIAVVTAVAEGPQGPIGPPGPLVPLGQITDVDVTGVVDKSVLYYDANVSKFKANDTWTALTLSDGGNF
jgi:hypothetical protein